MHVLLGLFWTFFKLGAFTFGGGYAMISLIENEVVTKKGWLTREEMLDIITIAESTPGPLAINMATFVGTKIKGILGALVATIGLVIPPFAIISVIALVLEQFKSVAVIAYALKGIQAGVVVLILNAFLKFFKGMDKSVMSYIFLGAAFLISLLTDFGVVYIILIGAVVGVTITAISTHIAKKKLAKETASESGDNASTVELAGGIADNTEVEGTREDDTDDAGEMPDEPRDDDDIDADNAENIVEKCRIDANNGENNGIEDTDTAVSSEPNTDNNDTYIGVSADDTSEEVER